jgi:hypothetical protein
MRSWILLVLLVAPGCYLGSLTYPTLRSGDASHVAVEGSTAYVARGGMGVEVVDLDSRKRVLMLPPPAGSRSSDHLSVADGNLFVLDARRGRLSVYSVVEPRRPVLAVPPVDVPVGPFSGVSASGGRVIVSGGTSELTVFAYDGAGHLGKQRAIADLGRGQPEVRMAPDGKRAVVSTHFTRPDFGITMLEVHAPPRAPEPRGTLKLSGAGFSPGGFKPANFPLVAIVAGDLVFAAHGGGLAVIDAGDLSAPRLLRVLTLPVEPVSVSLSTDGSTLAVVGSAPSPRVVLVDARTLDVTRTIDLPADARALDVALTPSHIVVAAGPRGALVFPRSSLEI